MHNILIKLLYIILFSLIINSNLFAQSKTYNIASIRVEGTESLDKSIVSALSGLRVGNDLKIPGNDIALAIKNLWKQGLFSHIEIVADRFQSENIYLLIKVEEKPKLSKYRIVGVRKGEVDDLRGKIALKVGTIVN